MTCPTSRLYGRALLAPIAAVLIIAAGAAPCHGAVSAPVSPNVNAEAKFQQDCWAAQKSMWERTKVARERFQQKVERRASMIEGLKAELAMKQQTVTIGSGPVVERCDDVQTRGGVTPALLWTLLALAGALAVRYFWNRRAPQPLPLPRNLAPSANYPVLVPQQDVIQIISPVKPAAKSGPATAVPPGRKTHVHAAAGDASGSGRCQRQRPTVWALS
jgi:hypothetical protein